MLKAAAQSNSGSEAGGLQREQSKPDTQQLVGRGQVPQTSATESRQDPITGAWTIFAPHREQRPDEYQAPEQKESPVKVDCPFCIGSESKTPPAVWVGKLADSACTGQACRESARVVYRDGNLADLDADDDWTVRVVPNRFPALTPIGEPVEAKAPRDSRLFRRQIISGGHEVIIEAPRHVRSITELDLAEVSLAFIAYRDRIAHWYDAPGIAYISVFKNVGAQAGASLRHSHSQLIASDIIPTQVRTVSDRLAKYRAKTGCCLQCDLIRGELKEETRVIANCDSLVAYCPFASPMSMMVRVTSIEHRDRFDQLDDQTVVSVSRLVSRVISWLEKLHPGTSYNLLLQTRPPGIDNGVDTFHWSIDIFPRLTRIAGFEFSSDCKINPMLPELAAKRYRECSSAEDPRLVLG